MRILVTGGVGFIGSHTVDALVKRGHEVRIIDNLSKPVHQKSKPLYVNKNAEFIFGDVTKKSDMKTALRNIDCVFHFAAYQDYLPNFSKFFYVNSVGTALLYEIIVEEKLPVKKIIIASSQAVYGEGKYLCNQHGYIYPPMRTLEQLLSCDWEIKCPHCEKSMTPQPTDELTTNPQNQYAISKFTQEAIALNLGKRYSIPTVVMRYSIVQGPRQSFYNSYSGVCRIFCLSAYFEKDLSIFEDGYQIRDYINIEDVVEANMLVLENNKTNFEVFNVGGGKIYTVLQFGEIVTKVLEKNLKFRITGEFRFGDTRHIISDITKLKSLGWQSRYTPEKSVRDYYCWLREQTEIKDVLEFAEKRMHNLGVVRKTKIASL